MYLVALCFAVVIWA